MKETIVVRSEALRAKAIQQIFGLDIKTPWQVTIAPYRSTRSIEQNALYWKICTIIGDETGNTKDDIHEYVRLSFLPPRFAEINGEAMPIPPSTAKLKVGEMADLIDKVIAWAQTDLGIVLPADERGR